MTDSTASLSRPIDPAGSLYQRRALDALPILVRQALAGQTIYYSEIAEELGMPNPRNMNFVLGAVGTSMVALRKQWSEPVPPIQALVINRATDLPGEGFSAFAPDPEAYRNAPLRVKRQLAQGLLAHVFAYQRWDDVLAHFGLVPAAAPDLGALSTLADRRRLRGAGESAEHIALKQRIGDSPSLAGIPDRVVHVTVEYAFASADTVDLLIETRTELWAVEVKSQISDDPDLLRGIFQCVKYRALLDAESAVERRTKDTRVVLATERLLPPVLRRIALTLGVPVVAIPQAV